MRLLYLLPLVAMLACEGPTGPEGDTGAQGSPGPGSRTVYSGVAEGQHAWISTDERIDIEDPPAITCWRYTGSELHPASYCAVQAHPGTGERMIHASGLSGGWEYRVVVVQ